MKNSLLIVIIITTLAAGGVGFYSGMKYQQSKIPARFGNFRPNGNGQFSQRAENQNTARSGFQPVNGEIIASDDRSITVKLQDGSSKIVLLGDSTTFNKSDQAAKEDLKTGEKVLVLGTTNSDGSVSAQSIQLNPSQRPFYQQ